MHRLADVELRLIMHNVDAQSLLRFARCSRLLLHAADARHTWKHTPISLSSSAFTDHGLRACSPLIRHAPVTLRIAASKRTFPVVEMLSTIDRAKIRLFELDASSGAKISSKQWRMMLEHRACRQLRVIRMNFALPVTVDADFFKAFAALPHLHTAMLSPQLYSDPAVWHFPVHLTSLGFPTAAWGLDLFAQLDRSHLRSLELRGTLYHSDGALKFFTSPAAMGLQELRLVCSYRSVITQQPKAAMLSLPLLHTLEFSGDIGAASWVPHLQNARALRRLLFAPGPITAALTHFGDIPPRQALSDSLERLPELICELRITFKANPAVERDATATLQEYAAPLLAAFPARFSLLFP